MTGMILFGIPLISPDSGAPLTQEDGYLTSPRKEKFPVINNIARFVPLNNYASSFGLQWNEFKKVQLDSFSHTTISRDRLRRIFGGSLRILTDKTVLEAGCGAGRFTEILLQQGARVFAVDISAAVEANYTNCKIHPEYFVCQADILHLPVPLHQFDVVLCIGVIQHTPDPEKTIAALCMQVKPGGFLIIDHYTFGYPVTLTRRLLRSFLIRCPPAFSLKFVKALTNLLWPFHRMLNSKKTNPYLNKIRQGFLVVSPVVDYHDSYPQLDNDQLKIWALLDTHDTLTDYYKHLRSESDIRDQLQKCGMVNISISFAGNGIEARADKPTE